MIYLSMPTEGNYGWAVCGRNLATTLPDCKVQNNTAYPETVYGAVVQGIVGHSFAPVNPNLRSRNRNVGLAFIEDFEQAEKFKDNAGRFFDLILTGSTWCTERVRALGITAETMIQGVNSSIFHPTGAPKAQSRFMIFSGGKAEYRKGTDVVIAAFKQIMNDIPEAHLMCSWANAWPETMHTLSQSQLIAYYPHSHEWAANMRGVMTDNGIPEDRYTLLPQVSNHQMAVIYRSCHIGVYPNRCEAGTNLVMMEAMACGMPTIGTVGTGHDDCLPSIQTGSAVQPNDWREPFVGALAYAIKEAYDKGAEYLKWLGEASSVAASKHTWEAAARVVQEVCMQTSAARKKSKPLTSIEKLVVQQLINGASSREIGKSLGMRASVVSNLKASIRNKCGISNDIQLGMLIAKGDL